MGYAIVGLDQRGSSDLFEYSPPSRVVYVIGNESSVRLRTASYVPLTSLVRLTGSERSYAYAAD